MERLSGEYNRGYTRAIQDITEVFKYVENDLKCHKKRFTNKMIFQLLATILQNRENLREQRFCENDGFIRFNNNKNYFEWFSRRAASE